MSTESLEKQPFLLSWPDEGAPGRSPATSGAALRTREAGECILAAIGVAKMGIPTYLVTFCEDPNAMGDESSSKEDT